MATLPRIGITMGDPAGIGPEIAVKALSDREIYRACRPLVLGDPNALTPFCETTPDIVLSEVESAEGAGERPGVLDVFSVSRLDPVLLRPGRPSLEGGKSMVSCVTRAVDLALERTLDAVVTGPISKVLMRRAGYTFEGHTELLAHRTGVEHVAMMLAGERLRVVLVTIHCALREVSDLLTEEKIHRTLSLADRGLRLDFGLASPRIAVAALNPHAGEQGLFGREETEIIAPAVHRARKDGLDANGPFPADTLFHAAESGQYDAVVCMYHDQGLIPLKLLHFADGVNVTLGLPIVRTSVDHGTAYDIAGRGIADPSSLKAAIHMAAEMAENRRKLRPLESS
ncbi:MAG: 4-hydroxythreonine-4-phosphate dehydrogenase PdxA [Desulfobacteraceae bacterium]